MPQELLGFLEYHLQPAKLDGWGGPFNGQCFRQLVCADLLRVCSFDRIVETGTFRGTTTVFLANNSSIPIHSSELNPRFFKAASLRLKVFPKVSLYNLDSRTFLTRLPMDGRERIFFYLDAHWKKDLPLAEEVEIIVKRCESFVIMVDDFQVPGDPDYAYDDYGNGKRLNLTDFPFDANPHFTTYLPNLPAIHESGARRGCIILASNDLERKLSLLSTLRRLPARSAALEPASSATT